MIGGLVHVALAAVAGFRPSPVPRGVRGSGADEATVTTESCPWLTSPGLPDNNYLRGTLVGYPVITTARTGTGNSLGNTIGPALKLVLVQ